MRIKRALFNVGRSGLILAAKAAFKGGKYIYEHREEIKGGIEGAARQTYNTGTSIYGHTLKDDDFNKLKNKINEQHEEYSRLSKIYNNKKRVTGNYKKAMLDSLMISSAAGVEYYNSGVIPNDITKAYELAYPDLSQQYSLQDIIDNSSPAEAMGYINGIKGKLFELEYVDYLNSGILPEGYEAALAESATKPGWDI